LPPYSQSEPVPTPLGPGAVVPLNGRHFCVTKPLGKGSFGVVWAAQDERGGVVALKEIPCKTEAELARVVAEGKILEVVGKDLASAGLDGRVPSLVATEIQRTQQKWRVRLAMSLVPGNSLEHFLELRRQEAKARAGNVAEKPQEHFAEACLCAGELLMQLAPVLDAFSARVYHRDITPRNIQIQDRANPEGPHFGLVDFGLAVDAKRWRAGEAGSGDLGGDGRYWPASAWYVFCYGTRALKRDPWLQTEYRTNLDAHSLGLTALRCLVELLPPHEGSGIIEQAMRKLRVAWQNYWFDAQQFWQPIFDAFRGNGDFESLRAKFTHARVHCIIGDDLCALRASLRAVQQACSGVPMETGLAGMPALCEALLLMVQAGRDDSFEVVPDSEHPGLCTQSMWCDEKSQLRQPSESTASPSSSPSSLVSSGSSGFGDIGKE